MLLGLAFAPVGDLMFGVSDDRTASVYEASDWLKAAESTARDADALGTSNGPRKGRVVAENTASATMVVALADGRRAASAGPNGVAVLSSTGEMARIIDDSRIDALAAGTSGSEIAWSVRTSVRRASQASPERFDMVEAPAPVTSLTFVGDDLYAGLANGAVGVMRSNGTFEALPVGLDHEDEFFGRQVIYRDLVEVGVPVTFTGAPRDFELRLKLQGCADGGLCYPPQTRTIEATR